MEKNSVFYNNSHPQAGGVLYVRTSLITDGLIEL